MVVKSFLKEIVSFKMKDIIEEYRNNKEDRKELTAEIWNIVNNKYSIRNEIVDIFACLMLIISGIFLISLIFKLLSFPLIIIFFIGYLMAIRFKDMQCYYLLDEFNKIEICENKEKKKFEEKISACNLYLK